MKFQIHTLETAPKAARGMLEQIKSKYGFIPNLAGALAEAPPALGAYLAAYEKFEQGSLSDVERNVVLLAASRGNECNYCVSAHSVVAAMHQVPGQAVEAVRNSQKIDDTRLEAIRAFTQKMVKNRGWVSEEDIGAFMDAGYSKAQVLEVIVGVMVKTLSNYANHIAKTPLDAAFEEQRWEPVS
ncbi:hypothetical protein UR09_01495 [Candidatus Nitromaritima sp. SCGC AAA799-A02]|nr:hypothetical protein UR09_01495 [Candidatus Nitromaritima sp. SCGC AAA799-A02]